MTKRERGGRNIPSRAQREYDSNRDLITAVIGVCYEEKTNKTLYVKRSNLMENYPGVWTLLSIQYDEEPKTRREVEELFKKMSFERLNNSPIEVIRHISTKQCHSEHLERDVMLKMYLIDLESVSLNEDYYTDFNWWTPEEFRELSKDELCGTCLRMWSDYCVTNNLSDSFIISPLQE